MDALCRRRTFPVSGAALLCKGKRAGTEVIYSSRSHPSLSQASAVLAVAAHLPSKEQLPQAKAMKAGNDTCQGTDGGHCRGERGTEVGEKADI